MDHNLNVNDIGTLDVAVEATNEFQDGPLSVIPYTTITKLNDDIIFTFTHDVVVDPGGINERKQPKDKITYVYDGATLKVTQSNNSLRTTGDSP